MTNLFQNHEIVSKFKNKLLNSPYKNNSDHYARLKKIQNNRYLVLPQSLKNLHNQLPAYLPKTKLNKSIQEANFSHSVQINFNHQNSQSPQNDRYKQATFMKVAGRPNLIRIKEKIQKKEYSILQPIKITKDIKKNNEFSSKPKKVHMIIQKICFKAKQQKKMFSNLRQVRKNRIKTQAIQCLKSQKLRLESFYDQTQVVNFKTLSPQKIKRGISFKKKSNNINCQSKTIPLKNLQYIQPWQLSKQDHDQQYQDQNLLCHVNLNLK